MTVVGVVRGFAAARFTAGILLGVIAYVVIGPPGSDQRTAEASCGPGCRIAWHLLANSTCGSCTTIGTKYDLYGGVPNTWFVPQDTGDTDTMNEAAWLLNKNNSALGTEAGIFSGWWSYTSPSTWVPGLIGYATGDGGNEGSADFVDLTENVPFEAVVTNTGRDTDIYQNGSLWFECFECWPAVPTPRYNGSQAEVHAFDTDQDGFPWLGNCTDNTLFMSFQSAASGGWGQWGNLNLSGASSPYWSSKQSAYEWSNGGGC